MPSLHEVKILEYDMDSVYRVITDVEKYPEFLPRYLESKILERGESFLVTESHIGFKMMREKYVSRIEEKIREGECVIEIRAISGPFRYLTCVWKLKSIDKGTEVDFSIDFAFKSRILGSLMEAVFAASAEKMMDAFEKRTREQQILHKCKKK